MKISDEDVRAMLLAAPPLEEMVDEEGQPLFDPIAIEIGLSPKFDHIWKEFHESVARIIDGD